MVLSGKRDAEEKRLQVGKAQAVERTYRLHKQLDTCWADNEGPSNGGESVNAIHGGAGRVQRKRQGKGWLVK